jgi:hypothetical protein
MKVQLVGPRIVFTSKSSVTLIFLAPSLSVLQRSPLAPHPLRLDHPHNSRDVFRWSSGGAFLFCHRVGNRSNARNFVMPILTLLRFWFSRKGFFAMMNELHAAKCKRAALPRYSVSAVEASIASAERLGSKIS